MMADSSYLSLFSKSEKRLQKWHLIAPVFATQRCLSSDASQVADGRVAERFKTKLLLRSPSISELKRQQQEAIESMIFWASQQTEEGTELSWNLLDLLVENKVEIATNMLNHLVHGWTQQPAKLRPMGILLRLEEYTSSVQADVHTYEMILETSIQMGDKDVPKVATLVIGALEGVQNDVDKVSRIKERIQDIEKCGWSTAVVDSDDGSDIPRHPLLSPLEAEKQLLASSQGKVPFNREFNEVLQAWVNSDKDPNAIATRCVEILRHMVELHNQGNDRAIPTQVTYLLVISALARSGRAREAEAILMELLDAFDCYGVEMQQPNSIHFTAVIDAWAKSKSQDAPHRAWHLLAKMQRMARDTRNTGLIPSTITYNAVLNSIAQTSSQDLKAGLAAHELLKEMWTWYEEGNIHAKPDLVTYNTTLNALAESANEDSAKAADRLLLSMHTRFMEGDQDMKPDLVSYNTVLKAWRNSGASDGPERASALLDEMERLASFEGFNTIPDRTSFLTVINTWSRSGRSEALQHVKSLLEKCSIVGVSLDISLFNTFLDGLAKCGYSHEAHEVLIELCDDYLTGRSEIKPDLITFNTVIASWKSNAKKAELVFCQLKELASKLDLSPNVISFTALITAFAQCGHTEMAEKYFQELQTLYATTSDQKLQPDRKLYAIMLKAWKFSNDASSLDKGFRLLEDLKALESAGFRNCSPDLYIYNTLLEIVASSQTLDKAERAQQILYEMNARNIKVNKFTLDCVLLACSRVACNENTTTTQREQAFSIAFRVFHRLLKECQPDPRVFHLFFSIASGLPAHAKEMEEAELLYQNLGFGNRKR